MNNMNKAVSNLLTGAAVTMAVGTAAYMISGQTKKHNTTKQFKKKAEKAVQVVGDIVGNITDSMR